MKLKLTGTAAGLATAVTLAVALAVAAGAFLYSRHHFDSLVEAAREAALGRGELIREALEHQMLENDRTLIASMVESFSRHADIAGVEILDHLGQVKFASDSGRLGRMLTVSSPSCQTCHRSDPAMRTTSAVLEEEDETLLRVVAPILNREACHTCHDPTQAINGLLILDSDVGEMRAAMNSDLRWLVVGSGGLALLLMGTIAGSVQLLLLRRLRRFETTARLISKGDLDRRVPTGGSDTISWLAREFNTMADSMAGLLSEVRQQRERLETVINSIDDGIVVLDPARRIIAANTAFLRRTGHVREEVLGCACGDVAKGICTTSDCPTLACLSSGHPQVRICERSDDQGNVAWEEVHSSPIVGPHGDVAQVVEVWRDISERRSAEAHLAESHRLASLGMLASGFSHEINTPLATVLTCIEGILRESGGAEGAGEAGETAAKGKTGGTGEAGGIGGTGETQPGTEASASRVAESARIARDQILRCKGITQHFLRLSRGQSSPGGVVELGSVVQAVVRLVRATAQGRGVDILTSLPQSECSVRADEAELQHAIMNLLINAVEACAGGGTVSIEVIQDRDTIGVRVADDGPGVPADQKGRIFEPFVSFRSGGTGLGLFLALNFVRRWGGDITVENGPDGGAVFQIILPGEPTDEPSTDA